MCIRDRVDVEVVPADVEVNLLPDEREAGAELEKGVTQPGDQGRFKLTLSNSPGQPEEVEHVRVLGDLRGQFGVLAGQCELEVGRRGACPRVCPALDLVQEHVTGPAAGQGLSDVPVPDGRLIELVKDDHEVTPGHLCSRLLCLLYTSPSPR